MLEKIKDNFYQSLSESIKNRKETLNLKRDEVLTDATRVSKIVHNTRNEHHPYLIGTGEYPRLIYLFLCKDHDSFINEVDAPEEELQKKCKKNYDEMLWGHIDWDKMFQDVIKELSESDISEELGKIFEGTLVDYVPYAVIRYDEFPREYSRVFIFPDEREGKRQDAIKWVHLRHGSGLFKQAFYERFSKKTLQEFDKEFHKFVSDYLEKRKPRPYSFGLQAYNFCKNLSGFLAYWQSLPEVQYSDMADKKSESAILLDEYIKNGREQIRKFEKYQQDFDALHIDIK